MRIFLLLFLLALPENSHWWSIQSAGIDTNLRAASIFAAYPPGGLPSNVVWTSGSNGVVLRSADEGKTWQRLHVSGGEKLDFRGIQAVTLDAAYLMSAGEGEKSRIYKTTNSGATWTLQYTANRSAIFLDGISCTSEKHCFSISDPVDGKFLIFATTDGTHWNELPREHMPAALPNEGIFAASNSAFLAFETDTEGTSELLFATGGPAARVFHSPDSGRTWTVSETPITHSNASSGIFSVYRVNKNLVVVGGDYKAPARDTATAAYSEDNGLTFKLSANQPGGFRSAIASLHGPDIAAVGPNGTDISEDCGIHWQHTDVLNLNALAFSQDANVGWAAGPDGTIALFKNHIHYPTRLRRREPADPTCGARKRPNHVFSKPFKCNTSNTAPKC